MATTAQQSTEESASREELLEDAIEWLVAARTVAKLGIRLDLIRIYIEEMHICLGDASYPLSQIGINKAEIRSLLTLGRRLTVAK